MGTKAGQERRAEFFEETADGILKCKCCGKECKPAGTGRHIDAHLKRGERPGSENEEPDTGDLEELPGEVEDMKEDTEETPNADDVKFEEETTPSKKKRGTPKITIIGEDVTEKPEKKEPSNFDKILETLATPENMQIASAIVGKLIDDVMSKKVGVQETQQPAGSVADIFGNVVPGDKF